MLIACSLLLAAVLGGCGMIHPAGSNEEAALSAYHEILSAAPALTGDHGELADASFDYDQNFELFGDHYDLFAYYDINKDGIPELIALSTVNFRWAPVYVFTYADGEAVLLKDPLDTEARATFEHNSSANGAYITYFCENDHIHSVWRGTDPMGNAAEENHAYTLDGKVLTEEDCTSAENEKTVYFSDIAEVNTPEKE